MHPPNVEASPVWSSLAACWCLSSTAQAQAPNAEPTFTKDVLPILQRSCQQCHRPGTVGADVAADLSGSAAVGALDQAEGHRSARCRRGTSIAASASTSTIRRSAIAEIATIVAWVDGGAPAGRAGRRAAAAAVHAAVASGPTASPISSSAWRRASRFRRRARTSSPEEIVDPKLTEDRYVKWVQIIPDATRAVHHSHVYVDLPEGADTDGLGLGMGSNVGNSVDLIEYGAGNDADIFPDGTAKILKTGLEVPLRVALSPVRRGDVRSAEGRHQVLPEGRRAEVRRHLAPHPHRRRQRLGAEPRARSRTCCCARATSSSIDEPAMPTGALDRGEPAARRGVAEHSAQHRRAARALLAAAEAGARSSASSRTCTSAARA